MKKRMLGLAALALAVMLTGCGAQEGLRSLAAAETVAATDFDDYETKMAIREENQLSAEFAESLKVFAADSASALFAAEKGNVNYSPVSLYLALALTSAGAQGETQSEILEALRAENISAEKLAEQCGCLYRLISLKNDVGKLVPSASLWLNTGKNLKADFAKTAKDDFYTDVFGAKLQSEETKQAMSQWIREHTSGQLAPEIQVDDMTEMILFTTLDFQDEWIDGFRSENNKKGDFTRSDGSTQRVEYMCTEVNPYSFSRGEGYTRSGLSMKNGSRMIFILPDEGVSVSKIAEDPKILRQALTGRDEEYGDVIFEIPKFDFTASMDLKNTVEKLGAGNLFGGDAELRGMTGDPLFLSSVRQQSRIAVDEKGVSAAAFTEMMYAGAAMMEDNVVEMKLNRPFIYAITSPDDVILFVGICEAPTEA